MRLKAHIAWPVRNMGSNIGFEKVLWLLQPVKIRLKENSDRHNANETGCLLQREIKYTRLRVVQVCLQYHGAFLFDRRSPIRHPASFSGAKRGVFTFTATFGFRAAVCMQNEPICIRSVSKKRPRGVLREMPSISSGTWWCYAQSRDWLCEVLHVVLSA